MHWQVAWQMVSLSQCFDPHPLTSYIGMSHLIIFMLLCFFCGHCWSAALQGRQSIWWVYGGDPDTMIHWLVLPSNPTQPNPTHWVGWVGFSFFYATSAGVAGVVTCIKYHSKYIPVSSSVHMLPPLIISHPVYTVSSKAGWVTLCRSQVIPVYTMSVQAGRTGDVQATSHPSLHHVRPGRTSDA